MSLTTRTDAPKCILCGREETDLDREHGAFEFGALPIGSAYCPACAPRTITDLEMLESDA